MPAMEAWTLTEGGQPAEDTANRLAAFMGEATASLELALYDVRLPDPVGSIVAGALREASARGVAVRLLYNVDTGRPDEIHPPPRPGRSCCGSCRSRSVGSPASPT